jgi:MoaE-MoaD fusion protein
MSHPLPGLCGENVHTRQAGVCAAASKSPHGASNFKSYGTEMRITVKLFAALRERAGAGRRELELAAGARVADVWPALGLGDEPPGIAYARNREYAPRDQPLADGDEVAVIPPVSGGDFRVQPEPLDLAAVVAEVADPEAGAIATFIGTTRQTSRGRTVTHLEYDAYPEMAEAEMSKIASAVIAAHAVRRVAIAHRTGHVPIGEASVIIAVSAAHRGAAMDACREAIDTLKQTVPVWKKEVFEGGEQWIGREGSA